MAVDLRLNAETLHKSKLGGSDDGDGREAFHVTTSAACPDAILDFTFALRNRAIWHGIRC